MGYQIANAVDNRGWNTTNVTNFASMFQNATNFGLTQANPLICDQATCDFSWDMSSATTTASMFRSCINYNGAGMGLVITGNIQNMSSMFFGATSFNKNVPRLVKASVTNMANMFRGATSFGTTWIESLDIDTWVTSNVTDMSFTFADSGFKGLLVFNAQQNGTSIRNWDVSSVTKFNSMFQNCTNFNLNLNGWDVSAGTTFNNMFRSCTSLGNGQVAGATYDFLLANWRTPLGIDFQQMFFNCSSPQLDNLDVNNWTVSSNATNLSFMFDGCIALGQNTGSEDLTGWDVSNVTTFRNMFRSTTNFDGDVSQWETANATDMQQMFSLAANFNSDILYQPGTNIWDTSSVINMNNMFNGALIFDRSIGATQAAGGWDTSSVTNMSTMFFSTPPFDQPLGNWDIRNVTNFSNFMGDKDVGIPGQPNVYSEASLSDCYIKWEAQTPQPNISISFGSAEFVNDIASTNAVASLAGTYNWNMTDGGPG